MSRPLRILLIGNTGRIDCLAEAFANSSHENDVYALADVHNPGLVEKCARVEVGAIDDVSLVDSYAREVKPDFIFIGPEQPLASGVVDAMHQRGIPSVAPTKAGARIETSKSVCRRLLDRHAPQYNPRYRHFLTSEGLKEYASDLGEFAIKPDGLTGGKGVKVFGVHFGSVAEGLDYCSEVLSRDRQGLLIEERLDGEEFSVQSLCDGTHIAHCPPVQDHKRAFEGDRGPNTGGVGSYSCSDHSLPFLTPDLVREAEAVNELVFHAIASELGDPYRGILYGNFIATADGIKVIEYNARFGDPEVLNILPIMTTDFVDVCRAIVDGRLDEISVDFDRKSTVCKWIVPQGYPDNPVRGATVDPATVPRSHETLRTYFGAIDFDGGRYRLKGSRAIAFVGIAESLSQAEQIAEAAASHVVGPVYHRRDIGTEPLVAKRIEHMRALRSGLVRSTVK